jgi:hypothetical protein
MKYLQRFPIIILALVAILIAGFTVWAIIPLGPAPEALAALKSDAKVRVTSGNWITFNPEDPAAPTGFIFYPGARVDYRSYAPVLRKIAEQGYFVVLLKAPLNLALFSPNAALPVFDAYPEIKHWAVGGHSLGGVAAAQFASANPGKVKGVVLWASYPADDGLLATDAKVVSIYGTNDGLGTVENIKKAGKLVPADTVYVPIEGGNHGQFGAYGPQPGDNPADISAEEQWNQTVTATVKLLSQITP